MAIGLDIELLLTRNGRHIPAGERGGVETEVGIWVRVEASRGNSTGRSQPNYWPCTTR